MPRPRIATRFAVLGVCAGLAPVLAGLALAEAPEAGEIVRELTGAPVFSADGREVGSVQSVASGEDGAVASVTIKTAMHLGLGERIVTLPGDRLVVLRGAVVLDLPAEALEAPPALD